MILRYFSVEHFFGFHFEFLFESFQYFSVFSHEIIDLVSKASCSNSFIANAIKSHLTQFLISFFNLKKLKMLKVPCVSTGFCFVAPSTRYWQTFWHSGPKFYSLYSLGQNLLFLSQNLSNYLQKAFRKCFSSSIYQLNRYLS